MVKSDNGLMVKAPKAIITGARRQMCVGGLTVSCHGKGMDEWMASADRGRKFGLS